MDDLLLLRTQLELSAADLGHKVLRYYDALHELRRLTVLLFNTPGPDQAEIEKWFTDEGFGVDPDGFWLSLPLLEKFRAGRAPANAVSFSWHPDLKDNKTAQRRMYRLNSTGPILKEIKDRLADPIWIYYQDITNTSMQFPYIDESTAITPDFDWSTYHTWRSVEPSVNPGREIRWTAPSIDYAGEGLILSVSIPVYLGENFAGLWSMDISQSDLLRKALPDEILPGQINFIVNDQGKIAAHPIIETEIDKEKGSIYQRGLRTLGPGWEKVDLAELSASGKGDFTIKNRAGDDIHCCYCSVPELGWILFSTAPADSVAQSLVIRVNQALNRVSNGDLSQRLVFPERADAYSSLISNFNDMVQVLEAQEKQRDITETALRKSEAQYRKLFLQAPVGILQFTMEGRYRRVNPSLAAMLGYDSPEQMIAEVDNLRRLVVEPDQEKELRRLLAEKIGLQGFELHLRKRDRSDVWLAVSSGKRRKNTPYLDGFALDITIRKKTQEKLEETEERWSFALEGSRDGVWDWIIQTGQAFYSHRWKEMLGYSGSEVAESIDEWKTRVHPEDGARIESDLNNHFNGETPFFENEHRVLRRDGTYMWTLARGKVIRRTEAGMPVRMIGTQTDITDRKNAESELQQSEKKFRQVFETSPQAIALTAMETGRLVDVNHKFCEITHCSKGDVIGKTTTELGFYSPADRKRFSDELRTKGRVNGLEMVFKDMENGSDIYALMFASPIQIKGEWFILTAFNDITQAKRLEMQLHQAQKMEAVGTLAGGVAHDFNNLLQAINGYTQIMLMDREPDDPDYPNLKAIQQSGERAAQLVRQLLLFSRKVEIERRAVDINQELKQTIRLLERIIPKMIEIETQTEKDLWTVKADPLQIESVLLNLGSNAADAMPEGGKLFFKTENFILDLDYPQSPLGIIPGRYVRISVSDTGSGIAKEDQPHIFEPFFTTKEVGKGTGLGLASAYGIIKGHGGVINCYSELGMGASFKLYLPVMEEDDGGENQLLEDAGLKGGRETILLVDDEAHIRGFAQTALSRFGYTVITAANGEEALRIYKEKGRGIDLIILDIGMPGMGGLNCMKELKELNPKALIIIASGYPVNGRIKEALDSGAEGYMGKPYQIKELITTIKSILKQ